MVDILSTQPKLLTLRQIILAISMCYPKCGEILFSVDKDYTVCSSRATLVASTLIYIGPLSARQESCRADNGPI